MIDTLLRAILNPQQILFKAWQATSLGSFKLRLDYDVFPRPHYAFCTYHAARLAERLGIPKISLIEFGVAGGNGLVELERLADAVEKEFSTRIEIWGFDSGLGLPKPLDYRDLPYIWQEGFFRMDVEALKRRLRRSQVVFGDVAETIPRFFDEHSPAPIGALFLDLDYYSSSLAALQILDAPDERLLPRIFCYCDDVHSTEEGILCDRVGQPLAIEEYNQGREDRCLKPIAGFRYTRRRPAAWNDRIYVHHAFAHEDYDTYVHGDRDRQLRLGS